jgi:hypothetical protein
MATSQTIVFSFSEEGTIGPKVSEIPQSIVSPHNHRHECLSGLELDSHPQYLTAGRGLELFNNLVGEIDVVGENINGKNLGGGQEVFLNRTDDNLNFRTLIAGSGIVLTRLGNTIIIGLAAALAYFRNNITGLAGLTLLNVGNTYEAGVQKLCSYRNGIRINNTSSVGSSITRFSEVSSTEVTIPVPSIAADVFSFIFDPQAPSGSSLQTGITGTSVGTPVYSLGSDRIRVWRNGLLMNSAGIGPSVGTYTETSTTFITLDVGLISADVVFIQVEANNPLFREDIDSITGLTVTFVNTISGGDDKLLIYRNGSLLHESTTIGDPIDRYTVTGTNTITIEVAAISTDVFTLYRRS